ncbi:MAG TPA: enoyl-ACP reductase FabI [Syntrophales bacterium]|nr:enoyl-ACP reductase FabI [Syntrophales bacterium]HOX93618.1 enoyl-ACP reductase FabI [Syntrophales bacterium]HPI57815.1 enoyl-ACP reductase FabI [Syntrophales bacterium]HPN25529.1 enoyl-ACP reductase FabI [Syntrophales bacterium]HQM28475.1 enoyl-ACP reductase FabI [Syntrophales bacterium]
MLENCQYLVGKKGLIVGIANEESIAYGCAERFKALGAAQAITYQTEKARPFVEPLAKALAAEIFMPLDVQKPDQMEALFQAIRDKWGRLDFLVHSIAYMPKEDLQGRVVDCSLEGFLMAMDISCYSFIRMARLVEPLMSSGGCLLAMSYYGANQVVKNYNAMGPVKAALESCVRYLAAELGPKRVRVHALSPGPLKTRAASGIGKFDELLELAERKSPQHRLVTTDDVGAIAGFLVSDHADALTGNVTFVDAGYHIID